MSDVTDTAPVEASPAATPPTADPPVEKLVSMPTEAFTKRLAQESEKAAKALLKELGVTSKEEIATLLKSKREADDKELSESQRLKKSLDEVTPKAARAEKLESHLKDLLQERMDALSPEVRALIDEEAGDSIEEKLRLVRILGKAAPAKPGLAAPATNAAAPAPTPTPAAKTAFERWTEKPEGHLKSLFYSMNTAEIERTRPK